MIGESDECMLQALTEGMKFVPRRKDKKLDPSCIQPVIKHPPSVMVWDVISSNGPGPIYFVERTMRQQQYVKVLQEVLLLHINENREELSSFYFMQDGAPCHTAKSVETFLENENVPVLLWPDKSPDLNPIENV